MDPELEKKLVQDHPVLFQDRNKGPMESCMHWGCDCDDGWFNILHAMCDTLDNHVKNNDGAPLKFTQVKEKFGGLRVYTEGGDDFSEGVIALCETLSYRTCERCGDPGSLHHAGIWLKTLCGVHAEELGYQEYDRNKEP